MGDRRFGADRHSERCEAIDCPCFTEGRSSLRRVGWALRYSDGPWGPIHEHAEHCARLGCVPVYVLEEDE